MVGHLHLEAMGWNLIPKMAMAIFISLVQDFGMASETSPIFSEWQLAGGWRLGVSGIGTPLQSADSKRSGKPWVCARSSIDLELQNL